MSDVSNEPWVISLLDELHHTIKDKVLQLNSIIQQTGMDESNKAEWLLTIKALITETFSDLISDVCEVQNKLEDNIELLLKRSFQLCKLVQMTMPEYSSNNLNLHEEYKMLKKRVDELEVMVTTKKQELDTLGKREAEACSRLGRSPKLSSNSPLPNAQELHEYMEHIKMLELEVFKRKDRFLNLKCKIVDIINETRIKPTLDFEKIVQSLGDSSFKVTDCNMKWIEEYYVSLQQQRVEVKHEIENLKELVAGVWDMLSEDVKTRNQFLQRHNGKSIDTLEAWRMEWKRCEMLKKGNVEKFVKGLQIQLTTLWEKCHFTNTQKDEFEYFHCTSYTEDLLTSYDVEIKKLQKYYDDNKEIFTSLEKWQQLWNRMIELGESASTPNRFKNRGGTLLKEEKERKQLQKRLPEYEERLVDLASNFQLRTGRLFSSQGKTIAELISNAHNNYNREKETKLSTRKQLRDQQATTPSKLMLGVNYLLGVSPRSGGHSAMLGSKQNLHTLLTPQVSSSKKRPALQPLFSNRKEDKEETLHQVPNVKLNDHTLKHRTRISLGRQKQLRKIKIIDRNMQKKKKQATQDRHEYDLFKKEMSAKQGCRSTLVVISSPEVLGVPLPKTPKSTSTRGKFGACPGSTINI